MPIFQAGRGRYGIEKKYFLPPLRLTLPEAVVLFLASRLIARWSDEYDQAVVSAFTKLADLLPQPIARHVAATMLNVGRADLNEPFTRNFAVVAQGWADGRVVEFDYEPASEGAEATARAGASLFPGARCRRPQRLPHRLRRDGGRHADAEGRAHAERRSSPPTATRSRPTSTRTAGWPTRGASGHRTRHQVAHVRLRFDPSVAPRVRESVWHRSQTLTEHAGRGHRDDAGRGGHHRDQALDPGLGRRGRGAGAAGAARGRCHRGPPRRRPLPGLMAASLEVELKLRAEDEEPLRQLATLERLGALPAGTRLGGARGRPLPRHADGRLSAARWACRLRSRDGRVRISLKGPAEHDAGDAHPPAPGARRACRRRAGARWPGRPPPRATSCCAWPATSPCWSGWPLTSSAPSAR